MERAMIFELRTSTVRQRSRSEAVKAAGILSLEIRTAHYRKLAACWQTEIGPLNQVMGLWSYQDLSQRARVLGELSSHPRWSAEYLRLFHPHLSPQAIRLLTEIRAPTAPVP